MKKILLSTVLLVITMLCFATTYYISPIGNNANAGTAASPWKTLVYACQTTTAGDIIHVTAGTYTETAVASLKAGVSLEGEGAATTVIKSSIAGDWSVLLVLESPANTNGNQSISGITFDGQYVSETSYKTWWGIHVSGRSNVTIRDCIVKNFYDRGVNFDGNTVWNPLVDPGNYATGNKFYNNSLLNTARCTNNYGAGQLNIGGQNGMEIYGNTMRQDQRPNFKNGWPIKYWENGWLKGVKIYNNTLIKAPYRGTYPGEAGDWDFAIELFNISGLEIANNQIQGCIDLNYNYKGTYQYSTWIHHNTITHSNPNYFESGIILEFATQSAIVEDNQFFNASSGVQFNTRGPGNSGGYNYPAPVGGYSSLTNNVIRRNLFAGVYRGNGTGIGIFSEGTDDPYVDGLTISNNTIVAKSGNAPYWGIDFSSQPNGNAKNITIKNNIVVGFQAGWLVGSNPSKINGITVQNNLLWQNIGNNAPSWPQQPAGYVYTGNIAADPKLGTDYRPLAGSPALNAGTDGTDIGFTGGSGTSPSPCTYTYSTWGLCVNGIQTRTVTSALPAGCTGTPILTQSCTVQCTTYTYSPWSTCTNGSQSRTVISSLPTGCTINAPLDSLTRSCTFIPNDTIPATVILHGNNLSRKVVTYFVKKADGFYYDNTNVKRDIYLYKRPDAKWVLLKTLPLIVNP